MKYVVNQAIKILWFLSIIKKLLLIVISFSVFILH